MEQTTMAKEKNTTKKAATTTAEKVKRKARTQFHVTYKTPAGEWGTTHFEFKPEMDQWMKDTSPTIVKLVRGVEKKFTTKILLA